MVVSALVVAVVTALVMGCRTAAPPKNCGCNPRDSLLNYSFYPSQSALTWVQASSYCTSRGAWLPTIRSGATNDRLYKAAKRLFPSGVCFWLGLSRRQADGTDGTVFRWVTGPQLCRPSLSGPAVYTGMTESSGACVSYCNFPPGEPNNLGDAGGQPFVQVVMQVTSAPEVVSMWNDRGPQTTCDVILCAACASSSTGSVTMTASSSRNFRSRSASMTTVQSATETASSSPDPASSTSSGSLTAEHSGSIISVTQTRWTTVTKSMTDSRSTTRTNAPMAHSVSQTTRSEATVNIPSQSSTNTLSRSGSRSPQNSSTRSLRMLSSTLSMMSFSSRSGTISPMTPTSSHSRIESVSHTILIPPQTPTPLLSAATAAAATAAMSISVAASAIAGSGSAADLQAVAVLGSAACWGHGNANYAAVTPFALSDTAGGALAGNVLAVLTILLIQCAAAIVVYYWKLKGVRTRVEACALVLLPGMSATMTASLHLSTLWVALKLVLLGESGGFAAAVGVLAVLFSFAFPAVMFAAAMLVPRRFVKYKISATSKLHQRCWLTSIAPAGTLLPAPTRRMVSSVVSAYQHPSPMCILVPFVSSFAVNVIAALPSSTPAWLCRAAVIVSALLHAMLVLAIVWFRVFVFPSSMMFSAAGLMLTSLFHLLLGFGVGDGTNFVVTMQAALSMTRSLVAIGMFLVHRKIASDPDTSQVVAWRVGNGGEEEPPTSGAELPFLATSDGDEAMLQLPAAESSALPPLPEVEVEKVSPVSATVPAVHPFESGDDDSTFCLEVLEPAHDSSTPTAECCDTEESGTNASFVNPLAIVDELFAGFVSTAGERKNKKSLPSLLR